LGNPGDVTAVGDGIGDMRIDYGPRLSLLLQAIGEIVLLLCGGDKSTQANDIKRAKQLAAGLSRTRK
jgi:putative addiction module killer protein